MAPSEPLTGGKCSVDERGRGLRRLGMLRWGKKGNVARSAVNACTAHVSGPHGGEQAG